MSAHTDRQGGAGSRPVPPLPLETERLVVVRRDRFAAFAVLAQAYAGEPSVRLVWDRRRRERRGSAVPTDVVDRRRSERRAIAALTVNDYLVFTREHLGDGNAPAFEDSRIDVDSAACRQTAGDDIRREIDAAAQSDLPVLITGGDAVSRRSLARRLHERSERSDRAFGIVDRRTFIRLCDAWVDGRRALGELSGGTVFVEEIGRWTLEEQAEFSDRLERLARARAADERSLRHAPLRIVSGSACCLIDLVRDRLFRADLFYRLNMIHLVLPTGIVRRMS